MWYWGSPKVTDMIRLHYVYIVMLKLLIKGFYTEPWTGHGSKYTCCTYCTHGVFLILSVPQSSSLSSAAVLWTKAWDEQSLEYSDGSLRATEMCIQKAVKASVDVLQLRSDTWAAPELPHFNDFFYFLFLSEHWPTVWCTQEMMRRLQWHKWQVLSDGFQDISIKVYLYYNIAGVELKWTWDYLKCC